MNCLDTLELGVQNFVQTIPRSIHPILIHMALRIEYDFLVMCFWPSALKIEYRHEVRMNLSHLFIQVISGGAASSIGTFHLYLVDAFDEDRTLTAAIGSLFSGLCMCLG